MLIKVNKYLIPNFAFKKFKFKYLRALRSRSLRDGSLPHKNRFATFVRSCSTLRVSKRPLKISYLKSACLITPFGRWNQVNPTIFEVVYFIETTTINIHIRKFLFEIRNQYTCFPILTFGSESLGSFLISTNLFTLCK